jgi:Zn-dependent protease/predicted transcriptional regulator
MKAGTDTPFGRGIPLGSIRGVRLMAHWSLLVVLVLLTFLLADGLLPTARPGEPTVVYWLVGAATAVLFFVSLAAHELAHAIMARSFGVRAERMTLWMLGGLTELEGEPSSPRADAWIAGIGPLVTVVCGVLFGGLAVLAGPTVIGSALAWLCAMSIILAVFNLLPGAPLDGGRLLRAFIWWRTGDRLRAANVATQTGRVVGVALVALGILLLFLGDAGGLWLALVGWFITAGARSEQYAGRVERLGGLTAADVMERAPLLCPLWWNVGTFLDALDPEHAVQPAFPLIDTEGRAVGAVTIDDLERAARSGRRDVRVIDVPSRRPGVPLVPADMPLPSVLLAIHLRGHVAVVVDPDGRPVGVIEETAIARATRLTQLGWKGEESRPARSDVSPTP